MNIFEIANISRQKGVVIRRLERIKREGSPNYNYVLPVTAGGAIIQLYIPGLFPESRKYQPLDYMEVVNNELVNNLTIIRGRTETDYVPAGTIITVKGRGVALYQVEIVNNGVANTTLGLVHITFKKEALTMNRWAQEH